RVPRLARPELRTRFIFEELDHLSCVGVVFQRVDDHSSVGALHRRKLVADERSRRVTAERKDVEVEDVTALRRLPPGQRSCLLERGARSVVVRASKTESAVGPDAL